MLSKNNSATTAAAEASASAQLPAFAQRLIETVASERFGFAGPVRLRCEPGCSYGDGLQATLLRVHIDNASANADETTSENVESATKTTDSLICKLTPASEARRHQFNLCATFQRECTVLEHILPDLLLLLSSDVSSSQPNLHYAASLGSHIEPGPNPAGALCLRDLRQLGCQMATRRLPVEWPQAAAAMRELGRLHGLSVAARQLEAPVYERMRQLRPIGFDAQMPREVGDQFWLKHLGMAAAAVEGDGKLFARMQHVQQNFRQMLADCERCGDPDSAAAADSTMAVLVHGDVWTNNLMFRPSNDLDNNDGTNDITCYLVDWQQTRFGSPALDLSHFLYVVLEQPARDRHFDQLLAEYYAEVLATCRRCGVAADRVWTFADLSAEMQRRARWGAVLMAPLMVQLAMVAGEDVPDMDAYAERRKAAAEDVGGEAVELQQSGGSDSAGGVEVPEFLHATDEAYQRRMAAVLRDFEARGFDW